MLLSLSVSRVQMILGGSGSPSCELKEEWEEGINSIRICLTISRRTNAARLYNRSWSQEFCFPLFFLSFVPSPPLPLLLLFSWSYGVATFVVVVLCGARIMFMFSTGVEGLLFCSCVSRIRSLEVKGRNKDGEERKTVSRMIEFGAGGTKWSQLWLSPSSNCGIRVPHRTKDPLMALCVSLFCLYV